MEQLPTEIVSLICQDLSTADVQNVRLASKFLCEVSTPFLIARVRLVFTHDSFGQLLEISRHPIISRAIATVSYELDSLNHYPSKDEWEKDITDESFLEYCSTIPEAELADETSEAFLQRREEFKQVPKHHYSKEQLDEGWAAYQRKFEEQEDLRLHQYGSSAISAAFSNLPNLTSMCMSLGSGILPRSEFQTRAFSDTSQSCGTGPTDNEGRQITSIHQAQSLLMGAAHANLSLNEVRLGDLDWKFLQASNASFVEMKNPLSSVRHLELKFITGIDEDRDVIGAEIPQCSEYHRSSTRLSELISTAPMLETLIMGFD